MTLHLTPRMARNYLLFGLYFTLQGLVLQVGKGLLLLEKAPPDPTFIIAVSLCYCVSGILLAWGFDLIGDRLPGRTGPRRGLNYAFILIAVVWFGALIGMIGFDFEGGFNLLTPYKIDSYAISIVDFINLGFAGIVLGWRSGPGTVSQRAVTEVRSVWPAAWIGTAAFPVLAYLASLLYTALLPTGLNVPRESQTWYFVGAFLPLLVSGASMPFLYTLVKDRFGSSGTTRVLSFSAMLLVYYWLMPIVFLMPFGYSLETVIYFIAIIIIPVVVINAITERFLTRAMIN